MTPSERSLIAAMREWALDTSGLCYVIRAARGTVAIFADEIESRDDAALVAFIRERCNE